MILSSQCYLIQSLGEIPGRILVSSNLFVHELLGCCAFMDFPCVYGLSDDVGQGNVCGLRR